MQSLLAQWITTNYILIIGFLVVVALEFAAYFAISECQKRIADQHKKLFEDQKQIFKDVTDLLVVEFEKAHQDRIEQAEKLKLALTFNASQIMLELSDASALVQEAKALREDVTLKNDKAQQARIEQTGSDTNKRVRKLEDEAVAVVATKKIPTSKISEAVSKALKGKPK